jgi:hypothetical protein
MSGCLGQLRPRARLRLAERPAPVDEKG